MKADLAVKETNVEDKIKVKSRDGCPELCDFDTTLPFHITNGSSLAWFGILARNRAIFTRGKNAKCLKVFLNKLCRKGVGAF